MKTGTKWGNAVPGGRTKTGIGDALALERIHRAAIAELNRTERYDIAYYKDQVVDRGMRELVGLMNNRFTFTVYACQGHWAPKIRQQEPYVFFRILAGRIREWRAIQRSVFAGLRPLVTRRATLCVEEGYNLSDSLETFAWRYSSADHRWPRKTFAKQSEWRRKVNRLIKATCRLLRKELAVRERKRALSAKGNVRFRAAQRRKNKRGASE